MTHIKIPLYPMRVFIKSSNCSETAIYPGNRIACITNAGRVSFGVRKFAFRSLSAIKSLKYFAILFSADRFRPAR